MALAILPAGKIRQKAMKITESVFVEFDEPPTVKNRRDAIKLLNLLIKAESHTNDHYALMAIRDAIKADFLSSSKLLKVIPITPIQL